MMSPGEMSWSSGLIPMIEPQVVTQIISSIADLALIISKTGQVLNVMQSPNFTPETDVTQWAGHPLNERLTYESIPKFEERLATFLEKDGAVLPVELNHPVASNDTGFPMRYSFHQIGSDGAILMLGRDLRPIWDIQQQLVAAQIALEKDYETQRENDTMFRVLMASVTDVAMFVSVSTGRISDCNPAAVALFSKQSNELIGSSFATEVGASGPSALINKLVSAAADSTLGPVTIQSESLKCELSVRPTVFRVAGEQMLLCRVVAGSSDQSQVETLNDNLISLFEYGVDGIVFAARDGRILSANDAFLNLADVATAQGVKGRFMSDFLARGSVDMNVVFENATRKGTMRLYATKLVSEHGAQRAIEISTSLLRTGGEAAFVLVIRDANRVETSRGHMPQVNDLDMASLIELIGSRPLKDIVAKTTDVVEKMCIETAVEMTSNNRVAAAEMLGLSRQSLYVKLRKYGLLKKEG